MSFKIIYLDRDDVLLYSKFDNIDTGHNDNYLLIHIKGGGTITTNRVENTTLISVTIGVVHLVIFGNLWIVDGQDAAVLEHFLSLLDLELPGSGLGSI